MHTTPEGQERAERIVIFGRTQSGKTTLVKRLVAGYSSLVIVDPKRRFELARAVIVDGRPDAFAQTWPQRHRRVIYRPDPAAKRGEDVALVLARVRAYGRTAVVVDEAMEFSTSGWILPAYKALITQGAELQIPVYSLSQRPKGIHNVILTEAEHAFVFDLASAGDREKVAEFFGDGAVERPGVPYAFLYAGTHTAGEVLWIPPLELKTADPRAAQPVNEPTDGGRADASPDAGKPGHGDLPRDDRNPREQVAAPTVPGRRPV